MAHDCKRAVDLMLAFLEGELPDEEDEALRQHLAGCPTCVDFLKTYQRTPDIYRRGLEKQMPRELADNLTAFLRDRIGKK